jgi:hypothetical protein
LQYHGSTNDRPTSIWNSVPLVGSGRCSHIKPDHVAHHEPNAVTYIIPNNSADAVTHSIPNNSADAVTHSIPNNSADAVAHNFPDRQPNAVSHLVTHPCVLEFRSTLHSDRGCESLPSSSPPRGDHGEEGVDRVQERRWVSEELLGRVSRGVVVG